MMKDINVLVNSDIMACQQKEIDAYTCVHRFYSKIRALNGRKISYLDTLDLSINCGNSDVIVERRGDDYFVMPFSESQPSLGVSFFVPFSTVCMDAVHHFERVKACHDTLDLYECTEMKMDDPENPDNPSVGWHVSILPKSEMQTQMFDSAIGSISKNLIKCKGLSLLINRRNRARLPSDRRMEMVSSALLRYSKRTTDPNDAFFAYLYHHHITAVDLTLEQMSESKGFLPRIIAAAVDAYLPAQYGDHRNLDEIKDALQKALSMYTAVRRYVTTPDTSDDDTTDNH